MNTQRVSNASPVWTRRAVVVLLAMFAAGAVMVISAGAAEAHHCRKPNGPLNVTADVGAAIVGVQHNESGPTTRSVYACADPPHQEQGFSFNVSTSGSGAFVSAGTCGSLGCTPLVGTTGATASVPSASVDGPLDRDNVLGASVNTGTGICTRVNGSATGCQLGGTSSNHFTGGDPPAPSAHPAVDPFLGYMHYTALYGASEYESWCTTLLVQGYHVDEWAVMCALGAYQQFVVGPVNALL